VKTTFKGKNGKPLDSPGGVHQKGGNGRQKKLSFRRIEKENLCRVHRKKEGGTQRVTKKGCGLKKRLSRIAVQGKPHRAAKKEKSSGLRNSRTGE